MQFPVAKLDGGWIEFLEIWKAAPYDLKLHQQECRLKVCQLAF